MKNLEVIELLDGHRFNFINPFYPSLGNLYCDKAIRFSDDIFIASHHEEDCCETHYLDFNHLTLEDFKGLTFDLSNDNFFKRIPEYGIELIPTNGHSIKIPGYGWNNGYYGDNISLLIIGDNKIISLFDVTECQKNE